MRFVPRNPAGRAVSSGSKRNRHARTRGPYHPRAKQFTFVAAPSVARGVPGVEFKTLAPEEMESVLLPTTCTFTPIGLALEDNLDVMIRGECLTGTQQNTVLPAFDVDLDQVDLLYAVFASARVESCRANYLFVRGLPNVICCRRQHITISVAIPWVACKRG